MKSLARSLQQALIEYSRASLGAACGVYFLSNAWFAFVEKWPFSDVCLFVVLSVVIHEFMYCGVYGIGVLAEKNNWFTTYKIPRRKAQIPAEKLVKGTIREALVSHLIFQPLTLWLAHPYLIDSSPSSPLPSFLWLAFSMFVIIFVNDFFFAISHYALHANKWLYEHVHKKHHQYSGSIGITAEYAHPLEALVGNQMPVIAAILVLKAHPLTWMVYLGWRLWRTYEFHFGYSFVDSPLSKLGLLHGYSALYHDFHHTDNMGNFTGPAHGLWDHVIGLITGKDTMVAWRKHCAETTFHSEAHRAYWLS